MTHVRNGTCIHYLTTYMHFRGVGTGVRFTLLPDDWRLSWEEATSSSSSSLPNGFSDEEVAVLFGSMLKYD